MTQVDSALVIVSEEERMKTPTMASVSYYIFVLYSVCIVNILEGLPLLQAVHTDGMKSLVITD